MGNIMKFSIVPKIISANVKNNIAYIEFDKPIEHCEIFYVRINGKFYKRWIENKYEILCKNIESIENIEIEFLYYDQIERSFWNSDSK